MLANRIERTLRASRPPATPKTNPLFSESQISCGTAETVAARAAPIPIETRSAGIAQQIRVLKEVNRVR